MLDLNQEERTINQLADNLAHLQKSLEEEQAQTLEADTYLLRTQDAQEILQRISQAVQQQAHQRISGVVSKCLEAVFDDPYEFKIEFDRKRGRTEARLRFTRGDLDVDPLTASGGGMVDVAAFALRIACLVLHRPRLSQIVVLDEPFKFVSKSYQENVRLMIEGLSKEMKVQIIIVTHIESIAAGKIVEL